MSIAFEYKGRTVEASDSAAMAYVYVKGDDFGFWADSVEDAQVEIDLLNDPQAVEDARQAEEALVTEEFCFLCGRCTDHRGEHSTAQLIKAKADRA